MNKMFGLVLFAVMVCLVHRVECNGDCSPDKVLKRWDFDYNVTKGETVGFWRRVYVRRFWRYWYYWQYIRVFKIKNNNKVRVEFNVKDNPNFILTSLGVKYVTNNGSYTKESKIKFDSTESIVDNFNGGITWKYYPKTEINTVTDKVVIKLKCPGAKDRTDGICLFRILYMSGCLQ